MKGLGRLFEKFKLLNSKKKTLIVFSSALVAALLISTIIIVIITYNDNSPKSNETNKKDPKMFNNVVSSEISSKVPADDNNNNSMVNDNNNSNAEDQEEEENDSEIEQEYLAKFPKATPPIQVSQLFEEGKTQNRWLTLPMSRLVINPTPESGIINISKYNTTTFQVDYSNRPSIPLNIGYLSPNAIRWSGIEIKDALTLHTEGETLSASLSYSTKWSPYALLFDAEYENGIKVEGKDFFYDANTIIRTIKFNGITESNRHFALGGQYVGLPSTNSSSLVFKGSTINYIITGNYSSSQYYFYENQKAFIAGEAITGNPARSGYWKTDIDLSEFKDKDLVICFKIQSESETQSAFTEKAKAVALVDINTAIRKRIDLWNNYLASTPQPLNFEIGTIDNKFESNSQRIKSQYYKAWLFVASSILPENPELSYDYPQFACGKMFMWGHGDGAKSPYSSTFESFEAMQIYSMIDPDLAIEAFKGLTKSIDMESGIIPGESLPPVRAQTASVLYKNSGRTDFLIETYDSIAKSLKWTMDNPWWVFGNPGLKGSKDGDFTFTALIDNERLIELAKILGKTDEVYKWNGIYDNYLEKCKLWHWASPNSNINQYTTVNENGLVTKREYAHEIVTAGVLNISGIKGPYVDSAIRNAFKNFNPNLFKAGWTNSRYPNLKIAISGMIKNNLTKQAEQIIESSLRDATTSLVFGEHVSKYYDGIGVEGVRPAFFTAGTVINNALLKNGLIIDSSQPEFVNIYSNQSIGINNLLLAGKKVNVNRKINANFFTVNGESLPVAKNTYSSVSKVNLDNFRDLFTVIGEKQTITINSTTINSTFRVFSDNSEIVDASIDGRDINLKSLKNGNCVITVAAYAKGMASEVKTFNVNVGAIIPSVSISKINNINISTGEIEVRDLVLYPQNGNLTVSSDSSCVKVRKEGNKLFIVADSPNDINSSKAKVTIIYSKNGYRTGTTSFEVTVNKASIYIEEINNISLSVNNEITLGNDLYPFDISTIISVQDTNIADCIVVDINGQKRIKIIGKSIGKTTATLTAKKTGFYDQTINFTIYVYPEGVAWRTDFTDPANWVVGYSDIPGGSELTSNALGQGIFKVTSIANPIWQPLTQSGFIDVDLNKTPVVSIDVNSIKNGNWVLKVILQNGSPDGIFIQGDNNRTGKFSYDISEILNISGKVKIKIQVMCVGLNSEVTINGIEINDGKELVIRKQTDKFIEKGLTQKFELKLYDQNSILSAETDNTNATINLQGTTLTITGVNEGKTSITVFPAGNRSRAVSFYAFVLPVKTGYTYLMDNNNGWRIFGEPAPTATINSNILNLKANGTGTNYGWGGYTQVISGLDFTKYNKLVIEVEEATCLWDAKLVVPGIVDCHFFEMQTGTFQKATGRYVFNLNDVNIDYSKVGEITIGIMVKGGGELKVSNISLMRDSVIGSIKTNNILTDESFVTLIGGLQNTMNVKAEVLNDTGVASVSVDKSNLTVKGNYPGLVTVKVSAIYKDGDSSIAIVNFNVMQKYYGIAAFMPNYNDEKWSVGGITEPDIVFENNMISIYSKSPDSNYYTTIENTDVNIFNVIELRIPQTTGEFEVRIINSAKTVNKAILSNNKPGVYTVDIKSALTLKERTELGTFSLVFVAKSGKSVLSDLVLKKPGFVVNPIQNQSLYKGATVETTVYSGVNGAIISAIVFDDSIANVFVNNNTLTITGKKYGNSLVKVQAVKDGVTLTTTFSVMIQNDIYESMPMQADSSWATGGATPPTLSFVDGMVQLAGTGAWGGYFKQIAGFDPDVYKIIEIDVASILTNGNGSYLVKLTAGNASVLDKNVISKNVVGKFSFDMSSLTAAEKNAIRTYGLNFGVYALGSPVFKIRGLTISMAGSASTDKYIYESMMMETDSLWATGGATPPSISFTDGMVQLTGGGSWGGYFKQIAGFDPDVYKIIDIDVASITGNGYYEVNATTLDNPSSVNINLIRKDIAGKYAFDLSSLSAQQKASIKSYGLNFGVYVLGSPVVKIRSLMIHKP